MTNTELLIVGEIRWQLFLRRVLGWSIDMTRDEQIEWHARYAAILDRRMK